MRWRRGACVAKRAVGALGRARARLRRRRAVLRRVAAHPELDAADVGLSLARGRASLKHARWWSARAGGAAGSAAALASAGGVVGHGRRRGSRMRREGVFVFPGQGSQWQGMALGLLRVSPVFAERCGRARRRLRRTLDWSLEACPGGCEGAPGAGADRCGAACAVCRDGVVGGLWRSWGWSRMRWWGTRQGEIAAATWRAACRWRTPRARGAAQRGR